VDGEKNIPAWHNPDQPPYVLELKEAAEHDIRMLVEEWHKHDRILKGKEEQAQKFRDEADQRKRKAEDELKKAEDAYRKAHDNNAPPPAGTDARRFGYWLLLAFLFIFEFPINSIVFRIFGEAEIFTYVATAAIAISLLVCAHQLGHFLREGKWDKTRIAITAVLIAIPILVIGAVAWLRQWYLSQVAEGTEGAWSQGMLFAFATFNLLIFTVATVASYLVHDPTLFAVYRARKQLAKAQREFAKAERDYIRAKTDREKTLDIYRTKAKQIKDTAQLLMKVYWTENLRRRTDREQYEKQGLLEPEAMKKGNQPRIAENALKELGVEE
jgi:F0F1-type ATP synthase membrane subunit b/b'